MWIDSITAILGGVGGVVAALTACVVAVNWIVKKQMSVLVARFDTWIEEHKRRHEEERRQVAAAFKRNGLSGPDGWDRSRPGSREQ